MAGQGATAEKKDGAPAIVNVFFKTILRSPLHKRFSGRVLLLTFTGRKSGKQYTTPVRYLRDGNTVRCFVDTPWWKNLRGGAPVTLRLEGRDRRGTAEVVSDDRAAIEQGFTRLMEANLASASHYDVAQTPDGKLDMASVREVAAGRVMLVITLRD